MNANWPKWIKASLVKHFAAAFESAPALKMFVEGEYRDTRLDKEYVELRIDGPIVTHQPNNQYHLEVTPNVFTATTMGANTYRHHEVAGRVQAAFLKGIPVYGEGEEPIGCLQLKGPVRFNYFGQIDTTLKIENSTVDAEYTLTLAGS